MRAYCVIGFSLAALLTATPALADSALPTGYGGAGNILNPGGQPLALARDPGGLTGLDAARTPTGLLYATPPEMTDLVQSKTDPDWWHRAWIDGGAVGTFGPGSGGAGLSHYGDFGSGLLAASVGFYAENRKTADYISALAQNAGRDDQYYELQAGRYGDYSVTASFDSIPHETGTRARSIWDGVGTGNLTLKPGLVPGASSAAQVTAVADASAPATLKVTREKAGLAVVYTPFDRIEATVQLSNEWREGAQAMGATFGYPFEDGATQIIQPVHYRTFDVTTALSYKGEEWQANLTYNGSFFRNAIAALTWQNPGLENVAASSFIPVQGRLSLPPDNNYNTMKADVAGLLSPALRFSSSLSYSLMRQDDALIPPAIGTGIISGAGGPINLSDWNTIAALSTPHAHAAIDIFNAFVRLQYTVSADLSFQFELRDHDEANNTDYLALNPLTGQYGYIALDGGLAPFSPRLSGVYQSNVPGSVEQIRNMPFANDNLELTASATWRIDNHLKFDASVVHNTIRHTIREVPDADDNRLRLQLAATGYDWGTLRLSYEYGSLTGSDYTSNPYTAYYSASLPGYLPRNAGGDIPYTLTNLRQFDVGDRGEHKAHLQANYILSSHTDLQLTGDYKADGYNAVYGLRASSGINLNADFNWQPNSTDSLTGFFTVQDQRRSIASINATGATGGGVAGSAAYPLANAWQQELRDHNYSAGFTAGKAWSKLSLTADYIFSHGDTADGYTYATTGAFFSSLTAAQAGYGFPDIVSDTHSLQANLRWQENKRLAYRVTYRVDFQTTDDYHYQGLAPAIAGNTYQGLTPENFTAQTLGLLVQYTF